MQQVFVVEFVVQNMQCTDCQKSFTEHTWVAVVQVRQHRKHKRTMFLLEQMLIKHNICSDVMQIKEVADGLDFYWGSKAGSNRLVDFLRNHFPVRTNTGKKLISQVHITILTYLSLHELRSTLLYYSIRFNDAYITLLMVYLSISFFFLPMTYRMIIVTQRNISSLHWLR